MTERIDFAGLARELLAAAETLVPQWLPEGTRRGREWVVGSLSGEKGDSCAVNLKTGMWADFATGERGGDLLSLYAAIHSMRQVDAYRELRDNSRPAVVDVPAKVVTKKRPEVEWMPICPVPADAADYRTQWAHYARGVPTRHWEYRGQAGELLGLVCRFDASDGSKDIQPLTWCQGSNGRREWRYKAWREPRPLYGLDRIQPPPSPLDVPLVIVVEGEKCADALYEALGRTVAVVTWPGGARATDKADFAPLKGMRVICWPDADAKIDKTTSTRLPLEEQPGMMAMRAVQRACGQMGTQARIVDVGQPGERPDGWDCADAIAEGWTREQLLAALSTTVAEPLPVAAATAAVAAPTPSKARAGPVQDAQAWRQRLIWRNPFALLACVPNCIEVMTHADAWRGVLGFDEFSQRVVKRKAAPYEDRLSSDEWTDVDDTRAAAWIAQAEGFVPSSSYVAEAVNVVARSNSFHPVRDWLNGLRWDGISRLEHWMVDHLAVEDSEYVRKVSRYFLIGMVMRVLHPGCKFDTCLVLEGRQGKGKSTALRVLGGEWFSDIELDLSNKDSMSNIRGKWLQEFSEMGSIARAEASRQKSFLSRQVDEFRPSYGRREIRCPRQLAFAGTTNEWQWNKDPTGGRRFWPVAVGDEINIAGLAAVRDQLFAEALQCALAGERYWPDGHEQRTLFDDEQLAREAPEAFVELLSAWMADERNDIGDTFTLADACVRGLHIEARAITRDIQTRVGIALAKLGCERVEKRNGPSRFVYRRPTRKVASSQPDQADASLSEVPF